MDNWDVKQTIAVVGTHAGADMLMMGQTMKNSLIDGANVGAASFVADMVIPSSIDSILPPSLGDVGNLAITGALYAGFDVFLKRSPFDNDAVVPKILFAMGTTAVGKSYVAKLLSSD